MSVPKLRFKEFKEEWKLIKLGKIADKITSGARDWAQYYSENGSKFIRMTNLSREGIHLKLDDLKFVNVKAESSDGQRTSLIHGDILISITAELGKIGWIPPNFGEAFINQHTGLVRLKKEQADSLFIAYLLSTAKLNKQINRLNDSGAKSGLNLPTIASINIHLPKISEQNKIANFFVTIDEKIAQLTQKCELLARYKKGVMQQIFSQELRFKDDGDRDFPDWEEKTFSQANIKVIDGDRGENYPNGSDFSDDGYCLFLNAKNVTKSGFVFNEVSFVTKQKDESLRKGKLIRSDLIITTRGTVGNIAYFDKKITYENIRINSGMVIIRNASSNIEPNYLYKYFYSPRFRKTLEQIAFGSAQPQLTVAEINKFKIDIPMLKEQSKIANFLTSIDEKITEAQTYLDTVKQYKQGLLQQMFV